MKNFVAEADTIKATAPYDLSSGDGCLVGAAFFGLAIDDAATGAEVVLQTEGVVDLTKGAYAFSVGDMVYWDDTLHEATNTDNVHTNPVIGYATAAAATGDATVRVRLAGLGFPS